MLIKTATTQTTDCTLTQTEYLVVRENRKGLKESMLGNQIAVEEMIDQSLKRIEKNETKSCRHGEPAL